MQQALHTNYVLGTGLSIGFAGAGAVIKELLDDERLTPAALVAAGAVGGTLWFAAWIKFRTRDARRLGAPSAARSRRRAPGSPPD